MRYLLTLALILLSFSTYAAQQRLALVIGNQDYEESPLTNPRNDAKDMAAALKRVGFEVMLYIDVSQAEMEQAVRAFGKRLNNNTIGLFYYSGHGASYAGENYLIPIGAMESVVTADHLRYKTVPAGYVLSMMENANTPLKIVLLDACRSNPFKGFSKNLQRGLVSMPHVEGTLIGYATASGMVAWEDSEGRNSFYTAHLLNFIEQKGLTLEQVLKRTRVAVKQATDNEQTPWYEASLDGDFYFVPPNSSTTSTTPVAPIAPTKPTTPIKPVTPSPPVTSANAFRDCPQCPEMVWIPATNNFTIGSPETEAGRDDDEEQVSGLAISAFAMGKTEVTFAEYDTFAQATGRKKPDDKGWGRGDQPVINVTWYDAVAYAAWLSQETGQEYRLPTEAEWEYAARGGTSSARFWESEQAVLAPSDNCEENEVTSTNSRFSWLRNYCWKTSKQAQTDHSPEASNACAYANMHDETSKRENEFDWEYQACDDGFAKTAPVGSFKANGFGLHDMLGNVWEWTCSEYNGEFAGNESVCVSPDDAEYPVLRGGAWLNRPDLVRVAYRDSSKAKKRGQGIGFRVVRAD